MAHTACTGATKTHPHAKPKHGALESIKAFVLLCTVQSNNAWLCVSSAALQHAAGLTSASSIMRCC
jgi:hypothetical protein